MEINSRVEGGFLSGIGAGPPASWAVRGKPVSWPFESPVALEFRGLLPRRWSRPAMAGVTVPEVGHRCCERVLNPGGAQTTEGGAPAASASFCVLT